MGPSSIFRPRVFAEFTIMERGISNSARWCFVVRKTPYACLQHVVVWRRLSSGTIGSSETLYTFSPAPISNQGSSVIPHFADHKRDEVQAFGYDKDLHQLAAFVEQDFLDFLGVDEAFLNVDPPRQQPSRTQPSGKKKKGSGKKVSGKKDNGKKASGKKASGKSSGKASAEASGEGTTDASEFSCVNFVQAANTLAESMKEKREHLLSQVIIS